MISTGFGPFGLQILDGHCKRVVLQCCASANCSSRERRTTVEEDRLIQELYESQKRLKEEHEAAGIQSFITSEFLEGLLAQKSRPDVEERTTAETASSTIESG